MPDLVATLEESSLSEGRETIIRPVRKNMGASGHVALTNMSLEKGDRVDGSALVDQDDLLAMPVCFSPRKMEDIRMMVTIRFFKIGTGWKRGR